MNDAQSLQDLLDLAMARHQVGSGRRLADVAKEHGFAVTHTTINAIRGRTYKSRPSDETLRAIAWLASVPDAVAFSAAGLVVPGPPFADELPPGVDTLSPKARRAVIELLRVLIDEERVRTGSAEVASSGPVPVLRRTRAGSRAGVALAARRGAPAHGHDGVTGEASQDPGGAEPA